LEQLDELGYWGRRRGHHYAFYFLLHGWQHYSHWSQAGICRYRSGDFQHKPRTGRIGGDRKDQSDYSVHLFGQMANMDPLMEIADKYDLSVIEDAAQSITSTYKDRKAGSIGTTGCFSFYPTKNLGGIGDAGMIVTNDQDLHERLVIMRNHGQNSQYSFKYIGGNFRLDAIQAAALLVKLAYLDEWSEARRRNAAYYDQKFDGTVVKTPYIRSQCVSIYNQYVIRVPRRDELMGHLREQRIGCMIYYPVPLHLQECYRYLGHKQGDFPESEKAAEEVLALPVYPELTDVMKARVVEKVLSFLK
ncbi:MAG: DegT/DnrJ/EryC1/StrS family aminotransferase, partial [Planctomycetota bacterium]